MDERQLFQHSQIDPSLELKATMKAPLVQNLPVCPSTSRAYLARRSASGASNSAMILFIQVLLVLPERPCSVLAIHSPSIMKTSIMTKSLKNHH